MKGLTSSEVEERVKEGKTNVDDNPNTRTYKQIIMENSFTFFNFLNVFLLFFVLLVGSYKNSLFVCIIIINTSIGIVQEIRAKKTLDKLAILTKSKTSVIRDGKTIEVDSETLVLDDVILIRAGQQIPADAVVLEGNIEVNESLLTGESDNLAKKADDQLYSGSYVTSGEAYCKITHVGKDSFASKITSEAKEFKRHKSDLKKSLNLILQVISIIILPIGGLLFYKQYYIVRATFKDSVVNTVAALLGMIPEGLILLTSVALTLGAVALARRKTLVQELYCIETLARIDTLCLDKTGTITEGKMKVLDVIPYNANAISDVKDEEEKQTENKNNDLEEKNEVSVISVINEASNLEQKTDEDNQIEKIDEDLKKINDIIGNLVRVSIDQNPTSIALSERFKSSSSLSLEKIIPFSSERKLSGASFKNEGTYVLGAVNFVFPEGFEDLKGKCEEYSKQGYRVLVLGYNKEVIEEISKSVSFEPLGIIILTDIIRKDAKETFEFFYNQDVDLKVISGDDPTTVAAIAAKAGLKNPQDYVDATTLNDEDMDEAVIKYNVFGRVSPKQKKLMVKALQKHGRTVAMTGDGVNDVLALKEADCSIAMAQGSDAAKNIANLVLLDSNFASMPHIVNQGRRVINNMRRAASMFLIKTIFSVCLALLTILFGQAYPFEPIQMTLISATAVGVPTFLLAQENDFSRVTKAFLRHVLANAFPAAITITACVFAIMLVCQNVYHSLFMLNTACVLVTGWNYMAALKTVYSPLSTFRKVIIYGMQITFFSAAVIFQKLLNLRSLEFGMIILVFLLMTFMPIASEVILVSTRRICNRFTRLKEKRLINKNLDNA